MAADAARLGSGKQKVLGRKLVEDRTTEQTKDLHLNQTLQEKLVHFIKKVKKEIGVDIGLFRI